MKMWVSFKYTTYPVLRSIEIAWTFLDQQLYRRVLETVRRQLRSCLEAPKTLEENVRTMLSLQHRQDDSKESRTSCLFPQTDTVHHVAKDSRFLCTTYLLSKSVGVNVLFR